MQPLRAPTKVSLDLTARCLLRCQHCRVGEVGPRNDLSFEEICRVVDDLAGMQVFRIALSGGEPLLRPDIVEIITYAHGASPGRVVVSTSGVLLTENVLVALRPLRDRLTFKISLDGSPPVHDAIRGREGAFAMAFEAIRAAARMGFDVQVTTTLMRDNVDSIERILDLVRQTGCSRHYLVELIPVGRATRKMALRRDERLRLQRTVALTRKRLEQDGYGLVVKIPFAAGQPEGLTCSAGISECGILSDGRVVGCRLLPHWVEGNVRERPLSQIWADPAAFPQYRQLRAQDCGETCGVCPAAVSCRGGCRAYALGMTGDLNAPDSRCPIACPDDAPDLCGALE